MDESEHWDWSAGQALKIFLSATWSDLFGDDWARQKLLGLLWVTQKKFQLQGRELTCLCGQKTPSLPPVIFLHGTPGSALDWRWFLKKAADRFAVYALDRPGFGPVDHMSPELERNRAILHEILSIATADGEKAIIVGHSLGGGVAARLATDCPDLVKGLVLVGSSLDPALERILPIQRAAAKAPLSWILSPSVRNSNAELLQYIDFLNVLKPLLPDIKCPVAVVHSRDDRLVPFENVDFIEQNFSGATVNVTALESGGHFLNRTKPKIIKEEIERLLAT